MQARGRVEARLRRRGPTQDQRGRGVSRSRVRLAAALPAPLLWALLCALVCAGPARAEPETAVPDALRSFRTGVMAVLSRGGCNQGTCHGNRSGKGGFKLSLRGDDPALDLLALTRDSFGRRVNRVEPWQSLFLLKPTAQVPHEGGRRFPPGSLEHRILEAWVAGGAVEDPPGAPRLLRLEVQPEERILVEPEEEVELRVEAVFSNGQRLEASSLAVYEPSHPRAAVGPGARVLISGHGEVSVLVRFLEAKRTVRLARLPASRSPPGEYPPAANLVDELVFRKLRVLRLEPAPPVGDLVFLRRVHLDLLGLLPEPAEARAFLDDPHPDKRRRLVDRLLQRPEFADFWALKWSDLLRNEEKVLDRKGVQALHHWLREAILARKPLDSLARELLAARGSTYTNPPANFYRAHRDPETRGEAAAQVFLGLRLQCARCHNHPFDRWSQEDYYSWSALFARVQYKVLENRRRDKNDHHEFIGEQVVWEARQGEVQDPRTGRAAPPRFLGGSGSADEDRSRLDALAAWIGGPEDPFFARAQANRIWYHLMGRGLVDPVDDFRDTNPPVNPPLLEALAGELARSGYDLRHLIRLITASRTYGLSSRSVPAGEDAEANFADAAPRRLGAEQILDALSRVLGAPLEFSGYPAGTRAAQIPGVEAVRARDRRPEAGDSLLRLFGKPPRLLSCECERSTDSSLAQAFSLLTGPALQELLAQPRNRLESLLASARSDPEVVEELYWAALTRPPSKAELEAALELLRRPEGRRAALEDLAWALVNSKEFLFRH